MFPSHLACPFLPLSARWRCWYNLAIMKIARIEDRERLKRFFQTRVYLHLYSLGDLDDFYWPYTTCFGLTDGGRLRAVLLLYQGQSLPTLLALGKRLSFLTELIHNLNDQLPPRFYAHLSPGLEAVFEAGWTLEPHGLHLKMGLLSPDKLTGINTQGTEQLGPAQREEILQFYRISYPDNWFDPRMLETGQYFGFRKGRKLVSVAGVHVYSPRYQAAALGNIATLPAVRGLGWATRVTARCCQQLRQDIRWIGLNVQADNQPAISCYQKIGFEPVENYLEFTISRKSPT